MGLGHLRAKRREPKRQRGTRQCGGRRRGLLTVNKITTADATKATTGVYAPIYDGNGNVTGLVNASCASVAHYEYGPFGEVVSAAGSAVGVCPFGFSTKYTDAETGLCYYGYRYYDPTWGRWVSRDPIGERGGIGLYLFVNNFPIGYVDCFGLYVSFYDEDTRSKYYKAKDCLESKCPECKTLFEELERKYSGGFVIIGIDASIDKEGDRFRPWGGWSYIYWDPSSGLLMSNGSVMPPSVALLHEVDHALNRRNNSKASDIDPEYGSNEERRVVTGIETKALKSMGIDPRNDHLGTYVSVNNVCSSK